MGDLVFFIPPALATLKRKYPDSHITFVTAWGYKKKGWRPIIIRNKWGLPRVARKAEWGPRNQGGFSLALMMTNPHIDQLVHWHDHHLDLQATTCCEEGRCFPTWSRRYYEERKASGDYDNVFELDFGLSVLDNPIQKIYEAMRLPEESFSFYKLYLTDSDKEAAFSVMANKPRPRIFLLEAMRDASTRGWDPAKIPALESAIQKKYGAPPLWFGRRHIPKINGQPLTLRQNIATLTYADIGIGVPSGPLHFAAAVGLPTLTLYGDQPLHRAAPAYFLNEYIAKESRRHRTLLGPTPSSPSFLKSPIAPAPLTPDERRRQDYRGWQSPGRQATKSCLPPITVDEIMAVLHDMLSK